MLRKPPFLWKLIVSTASLLIATAVTFALWSPVFQRVPFALYFAAVAVAAWQAGWLSGITVGLAGVLIIGLHEHFAADLLVQSIVLLGVSAVISLLAASSERADRSRRQSETQQAAILDAAIDCIVSMDHEGRVVEWNPAAERTFGYSRAEALGRQMVELIIPERYGEAHRNGIARYLATGAGNVIGKRFEITAIRKGGGPEFPVELAVTRVPLPGPPLFTGHLRDISERKRVEVALQESEAYLRATLDSSAGGFYGVDSDGVTTVCNAAFVRMLGFNRADDAIGRKLHDVIHHSRPDGSPYPKEECPIYLAAKSGQPAHVEDELFFRLDGTSFPVEYWSLPIIRDGEVRGAVTTFIDTSERKRSEAERRQLSAERDQQLRTFDTVLASLQEFVYLFDLERRFTYVNKPLLNLWKKTPAEALGKTFSELGYPQELVELHESQIAKVISSGQPVRGENPYTDIEGKTGYYEYIFVPLFATDGSVEAIGGATRDVTEQRRQAAAREELLVAERVARAEAERASQMKDEFLATLSHELRTPLNAILGWSQILLSGSRDEEDLAEGLRTIDRNARAQTTIIEDLLDMSRIISGKIRLDVQRVDLAPVVEAAVETLKPAADAKGVRLQAVLDPLAGPVSGDPARLQQIFWNLLTNAVKFTRRGGRVQVLLERVNSHLEVSVIDTGEGINPAFLPHVFDRFRQADGTTTRRHGGLGLGLAIVKQLVELHGGSIRAKSPGEGHGATFTVSLPVTVVHPELEPIPARRHPSAAGDTVAPNGCADIKGMKILVVDDEPDSRALVKRLLEDCNAIVISAASAAEAVEILQAQRPDVLVSDIGMPLVDGYELIRRVRQLRKEQGGETPAVALTAYARAEDRVKAVMSGFQHHVAKPVDPAELIAMIASLSKG
jgi:PAS domain S-box-containing protein